MSGPTLGKISLTFFFNFCKHIAQIYTEYNSTSFLDVTIFRWNRFLQRQNLDTKVYFKPADTQELLYKSSYDPSHTYKGIVKSQIIRWNVFALMKVTSTRLVTTIYSIKKRMCPWLPKNYQTGYTGCIRLPWPIRCGRSRCKMFQRIAIIGTIHDLHGNPVALNDQLNCQSQSVVYVIECRNC